MPTAGSGTRELSFDQAVEFVLRTGHEAWAFAARLGEDEGDIYVISRYDHDPADPLDRVDPFWVKMVGGSLRDPDQYREAEFSPTQISPPIRSLVFWPVREACGALDQPLAQALKQLAQMTQDYPA